jgi:hypothetical protein
MRFDRGQGCKRRYPSGFENPARAPGMHRGATHQGTHTTVAVPALQPFR